MSGKSETRPVTAYYRYQPISEFRGSRRRLRGPCRVLVFCGLAVLLPCLLLLAPLLIRYELFKEALYSLGESDLVTVDKAISTFWCEGQELRMNGTFHAYLLHQQPQISEDLQQIEMHKHMQLADDSLEYWGFFMLMGSKVTLSVCSRFDGARLMVVKGTKNLKHCALLDPSPGKDQIDPWEEDVSAQKGEKIEVTFQQGDKEMEQVESGNHPQPHSPSALPAPRNKNTKPRLKVVPSKAADVKVDILSPPQDSVPEETPEQRTEAPPPGLTISSRKPPRPFRVRGKKTETDAVLVPVEVTPGDEAPPESEPDIKTRHENMKVSRHKTRLLSEKGVETLGRRKRFQTTAHARPHDEYEDYEETEVGGHLENEEGGEGEDLAPNPVGIEVEQRRDDEINEEDIRSSGSSFAKNLWSCYGGDTLFTQSFSPSPRCQSQDAMMKTAIRIRMSHEIVSSGYYYYIFYSDNDIVSNDIFARFNIEKVAYSFPNYTNSCLNSTHCSLPLTFFSSEKVLLEVPLQDGVSDEDALAQMVLTSTCRPRLAVYFVFPVAILFVILGCAFV